MTEEERIEEDWEPSPVEIPIDGVLDLHTFKPREVKELLPDYLKECQGQGILDVRVIHGKGRGVLRRTVQSILDRLPHIVAHYETGGMGAGGWGATLVRLHPVDGDVRDGM